MPLKRFVQANSAGFEFADVNFVTFRVRAFDLLCVSVVLLKVDLLTIIWSLNENTMLCAGNSRKCEAKCPSPL